VFGWVDPRFTAIGAVPVLIVAVALIVVAPLRGRRLYQRLRRARADDPTALSRYYRRSILGWWILAAVTAAAVPLEPRVDAEAVGVAWPHGRRAWLAVGLTLYAAVVFVVAGARARSQRRRGTWAVRRAAVAALLPDTAAERRLAVVVSLSAGVCEELVFR